MVVFILRAAFWGSKRENWIDMGWWDNLDYVSSFSFLLERLFPSGWLLGTVGTYYFSYLFMSVVSVRVLGLCLLSGNEFKGSFWVSSVTQVPVCGLSNFFLHWVIMDTVGLLWYSTVRVAPKG